MAAENPLLARLMHRNERERLRDVITRDCALIKECLDLGRFRKADVFREVLAMHSAEKLNDVSETTFWRYYEAELARSGGKRSASTAEGRSKTRGRPKGSRNRVKPVAHGTPANAAAPGGFAVGAEARHETGRVTVPAAVLGQPVEAGSKGSAESGNTGAGEGAGGSTDASQIGEGSCSPTNLGSLDSGKAEGAVRAPEKAGAPPARLSESPALDHVAAPAAAAIPGSSEGPVAGSGTSVSPPAGAGGQGTIPLSATAEEVLRLRERAIADGTPLPEVVPWHQSADIPPDVKAAYVRRPPAAPSSRSSG